MKSLPISIIGKSIQIRFINGGSQKINKIKKIKGNEIYDEKGNIYHINLNEVGSIFEPKSKKYSFKEFDDFSDLEK